MRQTVLTGATVIPREHKTMQSGQCPENQSTETEMQPIVEIWKSPHGMVIGSKHPVTLKNSET